MNIKNIFKGLQGKWKFNRKLTDKTSERALGEATGEAVFEKRENNLLFYKEEGVLKSSTGEQLKISREHFYAYAEKENSIAKYCSENNTQSGLMYYLKFEDSKNIKARGQHLCQKDNYQAEFQFPKEAFVTFTLMYDVTGPAKNYVSFTSYERISSNVECKN